MCGLAYDFDNKIVSLRPEKINLLVSVMKRVFCPLLMAGFAWLCASCKVYQVNIDDMCRQLEDCHIDKKQVSATGPGLFSYWEQDEIYTNGITTLRVSDRSGRTRDFEVSAGTEIRIELQDGSHVRYFFDTVLLSDSVLLGNTERFKNQFQEVPLRDVVKIEVRNRNRALKYGAPE